MGRYRDRPDETHTDKKPCWLGQLAAHGYGTRNWLKMNQDFSPEVRDQHYNFRGCNRMTGTRRTTSWSAEDQLRWMYEGNVRNPTARASSTGRSA